MSSSWCDATWQSNDIAGALEELFPDHKPMLPVASAPESAAVGPMLRLERELFGGEEGEQPQPIGLRRARLVVGATDVI